MAKLYTARRDYPQAADWLTQGIDVCHAHAIHEVACPRLLSVRARVNGRMGNFADAGRDIPEALDLQKTFDGDASPAYAYILDDLLVVELSEHDDEHAVATADQSLAIYRSTRSGLILSILTTRFNRAQAMFELKRNDEALTELLEIEPHCAKLVPNGVARFGLLAYKARALDRAHRSDEARDAAHAALALVTSTTVVKPDVRDELVRLDAGGTRAK